MQESSKQHIPIYNGAIASKGHPDAFDIVKLAFGQDRYEKTNHPHRHDHYTLLILCEGSTKQFIDFKAYEAKDAALLFIQPGQVHYEVNPGYASMYVITFTNEFMFSYTANNHWTQAFNTNLLPLKSEELGELLPFLYLLQQEFSAFKQKKAIIALLFLAMLEKITLFIASHNPTENRKRYSKLMHQFMELVETNFLTETKVTDYAAKLFISAGHLNDIVKEMSGTNAKAVIDERRVLEAKRLLFWTQLPIREVGWKIGFEDPAYFTRFFKKHTGKLPAAFQRDIQQTLQH
ncbi:helix-turn-helix domain-containing protein [Olivibacter ginsenosidimutans]|uniref:Helix-turn-helix domain-containing protein n=1 Tax=Olivibacter ginsenosidimutans TaxID=1176537 RepID=A0ABP9BET0_9SPHI